MKQFTFFLLTILPFANQAQHTSETKQGEKAKRLSAGINFSPDYSYRTLKSNGSTGANAVVNNRNKSEIGKFGYTAGVKVFLAVSNSAAFETGIQYSDKGYKTKNQDLVYASPDPASPVKVKYIDAYQYIGIPLNAKFTAGKNRVRFLTGAGITIDFLLQAKRTGIFEYADGETKKNRQVVPGFKKIGISPMVSFGFDYKINDKIFLKAEPTFRYGILKTRDAPVTERLWSAGFNIGIYTGVK